MLGLAYFIHDQGGGQAQTFALIYGVLALGELLVGLFKWLRPSAEGLIFDGLVLLVFAALNLGIEYMRFQRFGRPEPVFVFLGLFMLFGAINRFRYYGQLRKLFAERPAPEHIAWFDDLVREIQVADPLSDDQLLDLPTSPHWKAKLLGSTVFLVTANGQTALVLGPDDFALKREMPTRALILEALDFVDDVVDELGTRPEMAFLRAWAATGETGADRQLRAFEAAHDLRAVVDLLVDETKRDLVG